jgi:diguanylate cyclase (GGDEF)-like protein
LPTTNLQTFVVITGLMSCLMSLVLFSLRKTYPSSIKGIENWAAFPLLTFLASILYATQGRWHPVASSALPNMLLILALMVQRQVTLKHFGQPIDRRSNVILFLACLGFVCWTTGEDAYYIHRLVFISGLISLMLSSQIPVIWSHRQGSFAVHLLLLTLASVSLVMWGRAITAIIEPPDPGIYKYSFFQAIYLASFSFGVLLVSISSILMAGEQLRKEMEKMLRNDALTGALTRRATFEYAEYELARSARTGAVFSVLMVDLDHFKDINDRYGHQVGDRVLKEFVQCVEQVLRRPSAIGRYGGEEFAVILPDTDQAQAMHVAERIQDRLRERPEPPSISASIGVASHVAGNDTLDTLMGRADAAMYRAKNRGRDRIEVA